MLNDIQIDYTLHFDECPCCGEDVEYQLCGTCEALAEQAWDEALSESDGD